MPFLFQPDLVGLRPMVDGRPSWHIWLQLVVISYAANLLLHVVNQLLLNAFSINEH